MLYERAGVKKISDGGKRARFYKFINSANHKIMVSSTSSVPNVGIPCRHRHYGLGEVASYTRINCHNTFTVLFFCGCLYNEHYPFETWITYFMDNVVIA